MADIQVIPFPAGPLGTNCFLVINRATLETLIVDPGGDAARIIDRCRDVQPVAILLTHAHFDHCGAVDDLCRHFRIPFYVHEADIPKLRDPRLNVSEMFGFPLKIEAAPTAIHGGDILHLAGLDIEVIHTPGHTEGGVCYRLPDNAGVLSGDTLMAGGVGRTTFPGGDFHELKNSLRKLIALTPRMILYPGHEELGMVGHNPEETSCSQ